MFKYCFLYSSLRDSFISVRSSLSRKSSRLSNCFLSTFTSFQSVTGKSKNEEHFGKIITGKDSLSVSVKVDCFSIKSFLHLCYNKYSSNEYKKHFDWIDHIAEVKNLSLIENLNNKLINEIKNNRDTIWIAVPEIIKWENTKGFKYKKNLL